MKVDRDGLTFSTGKTLYANRGIVGLCLTDDDDDRQGVFYGYDGGINTPLDEYVSSEHRMTPAECVELADEMLKRWAEFRAKYARGLTFELTCTLRWADFGLGLRARNWTAAKCQVERMVRPHFCNTGGNSNVENCTC